MDQGMLMMIIIIVVMVGFMWFSSRKQKQRQQETLSWRDSLAPGEEVATVSGLLGVVKEVDPDHDQIVIDSEGSLSRWRIQAITKPPVVPAYVSDDEVDEEGNPLPKDENGNVIRPEVAAEADSSDAAASAEASEQEENAATDTAATAEPAQAPEVAAPVSEPTDDTK